jgi:hypothetical protein
MSNFVLDLEFGQYAKTRNNNLVKIIARMGISLLGVVRTDKGQFEIEVWDTDNNPWSGDESSKLEKVVEISELSEDDAKYPYPFSLEALEDGRTLFVLDGIGSAIYDPQDGWSVVNDCEIITQEEESKKKSKRGRKKPTSEISLENGEND